MKWYLTVLKRYAVFSGRARRKEFWMFVLFNTVFALALFILAELAISCPVGMLALEQSRQSQQAAYLLVLIPFGLVVLYSLAVAIPSLAVTVRRLHDIGKSGWWYFICLIPIVGTVWLLVLLATDSQPGENKYGPNPKEISTG